MKILIMGATGSAGSHAIQSLIKKGVRPTAAVRNLEKAKEKFGDSVDYVHFDYLDSSTWDTALKGINRLFFIAPPPKKDPAIVRAMMKSVKKAGVDFVLFQSGRTSGTYKGKPLYEIESDLRTSGQNFCILRPALYMQGFHSWLGATLEDNEICLPTADAKVAFVDIKDIGEAIATILTTDGHVSKEYNLTGAESLDLARVADIVSGATGRAIKYTNPDDDTFINRMVGMGRDPVFAKYSLWTFNRIVKGSEAEATSVFQDLTGRSPISFAQFAKEELA